MKQTFVIGLLLVMSMVLIYPAPLIEATSYESEANIYFKKAPEKAEDESTYIPSGVVATTQPNDSGNLLPKTATNNYTFLLLGIILLVMSVVAFTFLSLKKRKVL